MTTITVTYNLDLSNSLKNNIKININTATLGHNDIEHLVNVIWVGTVQVTLGK